MGGTGVIDHFLEVFTRYIDSGFGLLSGEVAFIATTLIVIDVTLAALFWSWGADDDIIARLVKKTLFVGVFAYLIGNWNNLARIIFESFAGLGLKASGTGFTTADLLRPGKVAQTGLDAGRPLLDSISSLMGYWSFFENFIQIACMFLAWALVLLAFFILAIQLFVTLIEFKLTTLAGFVLIPFGLFGKSAFMAERVLGNVISSGIKVLVLAVIGGDGDGGEVLLRADDVFERSAELRRQMPMRHEDQSDHSIQHRRAPSAPGQGRGLCGRSEICASRQPSNLSKSWLAFGLCE